MSTHREFFEAREVQLRLYAPDSEDHPLKYVDGSPAPLPWAVEIGTLEENVAVVVGTEEDLRRFGVDLYFLLNSTYRCVGVTKTGSQCWNNHAKDSRYCYVHQNQGVVVMARWSVTAWTEDLTDPEVSVVAENEDAALELGKAQLPPANDYSIALLDEEEK